MEPLSFWRAISSRHGLTWECIQSDSDVKGTWRKNHADVTGTESIAKLDMCWNFFIQGHILAQDSVLDGSMNPLVSERCKSYCTPVMPRLLAKTCSRPLITCREVNLGSNCISALLLHTTTAKVRPVMCCCSTIAHRCCCLEARGWGKLILHIPSSHLHTSTCFQILNYNLLVHKQH